MKTSFAPEINIKAIEFSEASFAYETGEKVFNQMSIKVPTGKIVRVTGARGKGKSCFLRLLAGIDLPQEGKYLLDGQDVTQMSFEEFLPYRLKIGYGFDYGGLISNMSIKENLLLPLKYHNLVSEQEALERVHYYLDLFDLKAVENERPAFIPGSMRKEACVVRAFILNPQMVVLDRPIVGMNIENKWKLKQLIRDKREEGTLKHIYITSDDELFLSDLTEEEFCIDNVMNLGSAEVAA